MESGADIAELASRLRVLESERGVVQTLMAYGNAVDYGDQALFLDCFTEDGVYELRGPRSFRCSGRAELETFVGRLIPESADTFSRRAHHKHFVLDTRVTVRGDKARCDSYFLVAQHVSGRPALRLFGRYQDQLHECADGRWRFDERIIFTDSFDLGLPPLTFESIAETGGEAG